MKIASVLLSFTALANLVAFIHRPSIEEGAGAVTNVALAWLFWNLKTGSVDEQR